MKISEIIKQLQEMQTEHGDIQVKYECKDYWQSVYDLEYVEFVEDEDFRAIILK